MQIKIIIFYCICEELLKAMEHREDIQVKMTDAEVMTVVLTAASFFKGNIRIAMIFLREHGYIPGMLSESRLCRRIHLIDDSVRKSLSCVFAATSKQNNSGRNISLTVFLFRSVTISGSAARKS